ncbi:uncharacterized protein Z518_01049 [Rhinocladiella mackenziei CBS 650.93]|uniref:Major facilitator superfamily (MFS) profile domain-containing protein n=1 Tax=Rhinocladiella mackenziei CBS 650.93 TaxID=1442369 RepID=A0A0D2HH45_9EURO|nr:uncharacterized protein Z518_01049 [Rhinocladiella mackenziei CBS 650.93]KIX09968.1 hypothetical protein Z518_01049 [Rhinocladiella mackenziei CBS 650.93]
MSKAKVYIASAVAAMTGALFGYSVGFVGGILVLPSFLRHFHLDALPDVDLARAQSLVVSSWITGALFGVPMGIPICARYGRKMCLTFSAALYVAGTALQVINAGSSLGLFEVGRLLNGSGVGAGTLVSPIYISEISPPADRGMLMSGYQVMIQSSALLGFWGSYAANAAVPETSDLQWQIPVAVQLVPGAILLFGTLYLKETPPYLASTKNLDAVSESLAWLRGLPTTDPSVAREAKALYLRVLAGARRQAIRHWNFLHEAFTEPIRTRLLVGVGLFIVQNTSGMNALNYYVALIFMTAGFNTVSSSLFLTGIFGAVKLISAAVFMFLCVRIYGNRFWLIAGMGTCAICMFILGFCAAESSPLSSIPQVHITPNSILSVLSVYIFSLSFGVSIGPIAWNVCSEIFPGYINEACCAVTTCTQWLFQIVVAAITPILLASVGPWTFFIFGASNLLGLLFCWALVPETRGVALGKEMSAVFGQEIKDEDGGGSEEPEVEEVDDRTPLLGADRATRRRRSSIAIVV